MRQKATSRDGSQIQYEAGGIGTPALVFVHGWSCDRTYWAPQMHTFAARHTVVAIDLAGHGESSDGRASWTVPAFGADVTAVIDQLGLDDIVLIGHSMGGDVIVESAAALTDRVRGLVWVDTYTSLDSPRSAAEVEAFIQPFGVDFIGSTQQLVRRMFPPDANPELVDRVADDMASAPQAIALDALRHAISNGGPILGRLRESGAPIVAINPDYRPTDEASLRRNGVRTVIVSGVGHFLMMEAPDRFNQALVDVVREFRAPTALPSR